MFELDQLSQLSASKFRNLVTTFFESTVYWFTFNLYILSINIYYKFSSQLNFKVPYNN